MAQSALEVTIRFCSQVRIFSCKDYTREDDMFIFYIADSAFLYKYVCIYIYTHTLGLPVTKLNWAMYISGIKNLEPIH